MAILHIWPQKLIFDPKSKAKYIQNQSLSNPVGGFSFTQASSNQFLTDILHISCFSKDLLFSNYQSTILIHHLKRTTHSLNSHHCSRFHPRLIFPFFGPTNRPFSAPYKKKLWIPALLLSNNDTRLISND